MSQRKRGSSFRMSFSGGDHGPFLDPFLNVNPCCCCCGHSSQNITYGIKAVATISMVVSAGYLILGCWFAFSALMVSADPSTSILEPGNVLSGLRTEDSTKTQANEQEIADTNRANLMDILLICSITNIIGGAIRFLCSFYLLKSAEKQSKHRAAKIWCGLHFGLVIIVTTVVLATGQRHPDVISSMNLEIFLYLAGIDFVLLLYFLWVIIVFVKEVIDMPGV